MPPENMDKILYLLGEMNAKLDALTSQAKDDREAIGKLSERVSALEAWKWRITGAVLAAGGGTGVALVRMFAF